MPFAACGDGKANQMFVRGFNLDHGTDFETRIESMQINMPTHAHGQGYSDLNLLIPELADGRRYPLEAALHTVSNAREEVTRDGRVRGILAADSPYWDMPNVIVTMYCPRASFG